MVLPNVVFKSFSLAYLFLFFVQCIAAQEQGGDTNTEVLTKLNEITETVKSLESSINTTSNEIMTNYKSTLESKDENFTTTIESYKQRVTTKLGEIESTLLTQISNLELAVNTTKDEVEEFKRKIHNENNPTSASSSQDTERLRLNDQCSFVNDWQVMDHHQFYNAAFMKNTYSSPHFKERSISSSYSAVDGDHETLYHSERVLSPWWLVDLESEINIYKIEILSRQDCCSERFHDVEVRLGREENQLQLGGFDSYQLILFYKGPYSSGDGILVCNFDQGVKGRYLSIEIINQVEFLQLVTVNVYAKRQ